MSDVATQIRHRRDNRSRIERVDFYRASAVAVSLRKVVMKSVRNPRPWIFRALLFFAVLIPTGKAAALSSHTFSSWSADGESDTTTPNSKAANHESIIPPGTILP